MPYPRTGKPAVAPARAGNADPGRRHHAHRAGHAVHGRISVRAVHRSLRLVIATGIAAAGLCLVIGLTALAVKIGAPAGPGHPGAGPDAIGLSASHDGLHRPASPGGRRRTPRVRTVHVYRGTGRGQRGPFLIGKPGTWGLSWAFSCGAGHDGQFVATGRSRAAGHDIAVAASGPAGHGITWASSDPGRHVLTVNSRCAWAIRVVLAPARG